MSDRMGITSGIAGAIAALGFAVAHALMITDIWFSLPMQMIAGALCDSCLGATYEMLRETALLGSLKRLTADSIPGLQTIHRTYPDIPEEDDYHEYFSH